MKLFRTHGLLPHVVRQMSVRDFNLLCDSAEAAGFDEDDDEDW